MCTTCRWVIQRIGKLNVVSTSKTVWMAEKLSVNAASFCAMGHGSSELNVESGKKAFYRRRSCLCRFHGEYSFRRLPLDAVFAHLVRSDVRLSDRSGFKG